MYKHLPHLPEMVILWESGLGQNLSWVLRDIIIGSHREFKNTSLIILGDSHLRPGIYIVVIPTELKAEEVGVPAEEPCSLDDSSTVFEKSLKLPELANDLEGCISLDAGCLGSLESGWADEPKRTVMRSRHEYWIQGEYAIVVGMEKQLNEELNILGQHTLKEPTTDAQAMEGTRLIAFNTKACPGDAKEDPGGLPIDKFSCECGTINDEEIFKVIEETDLLVTGLIMDESRGSMGLEGLNPDSRAVWWLSPKVFGMLAGVGRRDILMVTHDWTERRPQIVEALDLKTVIALD
ncbi:hypothetical protein F5887DRAFT_926194 [Amanita rubescens]|nr:hypothetical protein F5887DRAFT_926194 [Amanita rubescens]